LSARGLIEIHKQMMARYGGHPREVHEGKLEMALVRAESFARDGKRDTRARVAAGYAWGILLNRPFAKGNEPMALAALVTFLEMYGMKWECREVEETVMVQLAAAGKVKEDEWEKWVVDHVGKIGK
jgi:death-on-curing protein